MSERLTPEQAGEIVEQDKIERKAREIQAADGFNTWLRSAVQESRKARLGHPAKLRLKDFERAHAEDLKLGPMPGHKAGSTASVADRLQISKRSLLRRIKELGARWETDRGPVLL